MSIRYVIGGAFLKAYRLCIKTSDDGVRDESFYSLTPTRLKGDEYEPYEEEFSFIFNNVDIRNIALMGSYGAGKSTVMETWCEKQEENGDGHICTFISLAHFHGSNNDTNAIEGEILNQLIHKTNPKRVPKSRFRHTQDGSKIFDFLKAIGCIAYVILTILLATLLVRGSAVFPDSTTLTHPWWIGAWCAFSIIILYSALRRDKADKLLRRIKFFGNEVDLFEINKDQSEKSGSESHDPIFNRYMDDVLYLLNNSGSDVYVFEDIDRFNDSIEIFEKLRELNNLANDCRPKRLKPLRFFYLMRESLFKTPEDRVKFFDFIIPIIPFADPDGNFDVLRSGLQDLGLNVGNLFVYEISAFIPDPRALQEIVNEVQHYQKHVFRNNNEPLTKDEAEHLIAAVAYKVIFPTDFSNFQRGKGYVAELLKKRDNLIASRRSKLDSEKEDLVSELQDISEKTQFNMDEIILTRFKDKSFFAGYGNAIHSANTIEEAIKAIRGNAQASELLDGFIREFLENEENIKIFGEPKEHLKERKERCLARIDEINDELLSISCSTLGKLLIECDDDSAFIIEGEDLDRSADFIDCEIGSIQQSEHFPLLKHLLSADLVDESSSRFVIRVRPEGLSLADQRNLAAIQGRRRIEPDYIFDKPSDVLMRIRDEYLMVPGVQNYSIFREILIQNEAGKLSKFIAGLKRGEHADFLLGYVTSDQFVPSAFRVIEGDFDNEFGVILLNDSTSVEKRRNFAQKLICYEGSWIQAETKDVLVKFANNDSGLLYVDETLLEGVRSNIARLPLELSDIDFTNADAGILDIVYENSLYEPNAVLAGKWVESRFPYHVVDRNSIVSIVHSLSEERLHQLVESKMDLFISSVLEVSAKPLTESEDVLVWVLNALSDDEEVTVALVSRLENCAIKDLSQIEDTPQKRTLLLFDIPTFSADNVLGYFHARDNTIDDALALYIHNHIGSEEPNQGVIDALSESEDFIRAAIESTDIANADLKTLLSGGGAATLAKFDIEDLDQSRVDIIVRTNRIPVSSGNAQFIRDHYPDCEAALADSDIDSYLALFNEEDGDIEFDEGVGLEIFELGQIAPSKMVELAKLFSSSIHLATKYPGELKIEIVCNHFDISDSPLLSAEFKAGNMQLKQAIKNRTIVNINDFISQYLPISCELLCAVLEDSRIIPDSRLELIAFQLDLVDSMINDRLCIRKCFEAAGFEAYVKLIDGKTISVPDDMANRKLVTALEKRGMSSDKGVKQGANGFMTVSPKGYERK